MHPLLDPSLVFGWLIFAEPERVVLHLRVDVALCHILVGQESSDLFVGSSTRWLHETLWQISLPVGVDEVIVHLVEDFDFAIRPQVKVDRFNLGYVCSELSVLTYQQDISQSKIRLFRRDSLGRLIDKTYQNSVGRQIHRM